MALLVEYRCGSCRGTQEQWVAAAAASPQVSCTHCGGTAHKTFGGGLIGRANRTDARPAAPSPAGCSGFDCFRPPVPPPTPTERPV